MKKIILFIILILLFLAVPITVYFVGQQQELRSKAAPATTLAFNPSVISKKVGDIFSLEVQIDTGGNNVAIAELHLIYDATKLEAQSITNGALAPKIAASGVVGAGTASITVRAESTTQPIKGTGSIAIVRFKALANTDIPSSVKFDTTTFISGLGESQPNVLVNTTSASVSITGGTTTTLSPTPTATGSATLTITPTPTQSSTNAASLTTPEEETTVDASSSGLTVSVAADEEGIITNQPVIQGKAPPGSTVTIVIHSDPITAVVTADANGNWTYTPTTTLADGTHTIVATAQTTDGQTKTASYEFSVATASSAIGGGEGDEMPISGNITTTIMIVLMGIALMVSGVVIRFLPI